MNLTIDKIFLARDKFLLEPSLRQPGFKYSACGSFTKNKERIEKIKEIEDLRKFLKVT